MVFPVFALGSPCGSVPDFILPVTSGLAPLELPAEFTAFSRQPHTAPSESAISRFQTAMESAEKPYAEAVAKPLDAPHSSEDRRFFANTIVSVEPRIIETQVEAPVAVESKPVVVAPEKPVTVTFEKPIVLQDDKPEVPVVVERPAIPVVVEKPTVAVPVDGPTVVVVDKPKIAIHPGSVP